MSNSTEKAPLSQLVTSLLADLSGLLRKEFDLARTEASETVSRAIAGVELLLVGMVFAVGAVGVLLSALVSSLAALFMAEFGMREAGADALAAAIVGVAFAAVAWMLMSKGLNALRVRNMGMDRTVQSLRRDVEVVKEKI